jgi:hypothetical protein
MWRSSRVHSAIERRGDTVSLSRRLWLEQEDKGIDTEIRKWEVVPEYCRQVPFHRSLILKTLLG